MPHFHMPLQAGSDSVLKLMRRKYNTELFASRVAKIREMLPAAFVGVDVIAGTNGESPEFFRESYDFLNRLEISQLHAFPYSERSGTKALEIPGKVPVSERKTRTQQYINLSEKKLHSFYEKNLGSTEYVLFEEKNNRGYLSGFTGNYIRTEVPFRPGMINELEEVRLTGFSPDGNMLGEWTH